MPEPEKRRTSLGEIVTNTRHLLLDRPLWLAVLGVAFFWFAGVLLKTNLQFFGHEVLHTSNGGIKHPNPGVNFTLLRFQYHFQ